MKRPLCILEQPPVRAHAHFNHRVIYFIHSTNEPRAETMAKQTVKFTAIKTVTKPATIKFKTKSGETVSFKALKTVKQKEVVQFRAKKK